MSIRSTINRDVGVALLVVVLSSSVLSAMRCSDDEDLLASARPDDAELMARVRHGAGLLGGGAWARIYLSERPYGEVLSSFREATRRAGGADTPSGVDGTFFEVDGDCVRLRPWQHNADAGRFRGALTGEQLARLEQSGGFVESHPDDCAYNP
jgi:hypothetical protein